MSRTSAIVDLTQAVSFRGFALNTVTLANVNGVPVLDGCQVDTFDGGDVEIRQFREGLALKDGVDVGGAWLGGRRIHITGTMYGTSRSDCLAALASLEGLCLPDEGAFGYDTLAWSSGSASVMPLGLRVVLDRRSSGGDANDPLAVPWSCSFFAKTP